LPFALTEWRLEEELRIGAARGDPVREFAVIAGIGVGPAGRSAPRVIISTAGIRMTQFELVWISSDAQLAALTRAYAGASPATKLLGTYALEPGVAQMRGILMPWMRMPLLFVAKADSSSTPASANSSRDRVPLWAGAYEVGILD
jgi:hypothetical protein